MTPSNNDIPIIDAIVDIGKTETRSTLDEFMKLLADRGINVSRDEVISLRPQDGSALVGEIFILTRSGERTAVAATGTIHRTSCYVTCPAPSTCITRCDTTSINPYSQTLYKPTPSSQGVKIQTSRLFPNQTGFTLEGDLYLNPEHQGGRVYQTDGTVKAYVRNAAFVTDTDGRMRNIARLYEEILDRSADKEGIIYWASRKDLSPAQAAEAIYNSPESLVKLVSRSLVQRMPTSEEFTRMYNKLISGVPLEAVVAAEMINNPAYLGRGKSSREQIQLFYLNILGRAADAGGLAFWLSQLRTRSLAQVFTAILKSNESFVTQAYRLLLGREPDAAGRNYWTGLLNQGTSGTTVLGAFLNSPEYRNRIPGLPPGAVQTRSNPNFYYVVKAQNDQITLDLYEKVNGGFKKHVVIAPTTIVRAASAVVDVSPDGSTVVYGIRNRVSVTFGGIPRYSHDEYQIIVQRVANPSERLVIGNVRTVSYPTDTFYRDFPQEITFAGNEIVIRSSNSLIRVDIRSLGRL